MRLIVLALLVLGVAVAIPTRAQGADPTDLPPREVVASWLVTDLSVRNADAERSVAGHDAEMLRVSPNEWTVNLAKQRRSYVDAPRSQEWNVGLERTVRWPGKRQLDVELGARGIARAEAQYRSDSRQALSELIGLWFDWIRTSRIAEWTRDLVALASYNRVAVEKRVKAGDAARLDLNLAEADRAAAERGAMEADAEATIARTRLEARFPKAPTRLPELGAPIEETESPGARIDRWLTGSAAVRALDAVRAEAEAAVSRERADRRPDPTLGVFRASEAYGDERIVGISLSIPLPGAYRDARYARAIAERDRRDTEVELALRELRVTATERDSADRSGASRWKLARESADHAAENVRLSQRAYTLGEADLQTLLAARRSALESERGAIDAQTQALAAHYRFEIEAGALWAELAP